MIDQDHKLSVVKHAKILGMSRSRIYCRPRPVSESNLRIMKRMDALHTRSTSAIGRRHGFNQKMIPVERGPNPPGDRRNQ